MRIGDDDGCPRDDFDPNAEGGPLHRSLRHRRFPIAGIGASAGGLDALRTLFTAMPPDTGIGFMVIQHLNAEHSSPLAELLSKYTAMSVVQTENGMHVEPNRIYVIAPNTYMTVKAGVLILKPPSEARGMRMPIDRFLCSLAQDCQDHAIAIVLSGSGSDGTFGVREVKANGGMVMVQDPSTAQHDGMPRSAIATGQVDRVLAPERMPEVLVRFVRHAYVEHEVKVPESLDAEDPMVSILSLLLAKTGHDFRHYKQGTMVRRIHRRMCIAGVERIEDYLAVLREREGEGEVDALARDLFIRVTQDELQSTIEELETSNEELKASNEEVMSVNEELQSSNEELTSVNSQLHAKLAELEDVNNDLANLLSSTNIATLIVASPHDAITGETLEGLVTTWNPGAEALYGYRADEMLGHSSQRLFHERQHEEYAHILAELRAGRPVGPYETERLRKDDTAVQVSVTHSPIHDRAGQVIAVSTIARDITGRVQAEAALRQRIALQDQFTKVAASVPGVICSFRLRPDGSAAMPYASPTMTDLFGVAPQDVAEDFGPIQACIHPDDIGHFQDTIAESARTMEPWRDAFRYRHPSKGEIWIEGHSVPAREADGGLLWHGYVHDVTERKRADKEIERLNQDLRQRLAELEAILEVSPIGIFLAQDPGCREMTANAAGNAMLGLAKDTNPSLTGPDAEQLSFRVYHQGKELTPDELPMQYAAAHDTGVADFEEVLVRSDGTASDLLVYAVPLHHDDGRVRGVLGMFLDITERKQMEQALRDKQADLERQAILLAEADRRKDEFLAVLGHELRNPLTPIRNAVHILSRPETSPDRVRWGVDLIGRQSEQLEQLVNDLLDVARITRGRIELRMSPLAIQDALEDAIQSMAPTMEQCAQALEVQLPESPVVVMADPLRLGQVFKNLLANAVRYTPNGGHIRISLTEEPQTAVVRVRDDGVGIQPADRPHLFDFFSRGKVNPPDRREPGGLGVGLALSKQLTERHGGTLEAHSAGPGHGSEFIVTLPLLAQAASDPSTAEPQPTPGALIPARRILVVDDNPDVADSLAVLLKTMGHQVLALTAGREAVAAIGDFRPDLVFLDIGMPDMDGYQVAAAIRASGYEPSPVLVALSGYRQDDERAAAQGVVFDRHLLKPIGPDQIDTLLADLD